jgi:hypothetical protein
VAPGTTSDSTWAGLLTDPGAREVFTAIRERSIVGRLSGMRRVPPNTQLVQQTGSATASWVKESFPKPLSKLTYATVPALKVLKLAATICASRELLMLSTPAAEDVFREDLLSAVTAAQDSAFIDPSNSGTTDTKPASITNGISAIASSGTPSGDIGVLFGAFAGDFETAFLICNGAVGAALSGVERPNAGARGGEIQGVPLITSRNCPDGILVMADAAGLAYLEAGAGLDKSEHSTIELDSAPVGTAAGVPVSLWQANLVALRVELFTNWARIRTGCVSYVNAITWS